MIHSALLTRQDLHMASPIRLVYEGHKTGDCKVHSDDFAERVAAMAPASINSVRHRSHVRMVQSAFAACKRCMDGIQLRRCLRNSIANASIHITAGGEKAGAETRDISVS